MKIVRLLVLSVIILFLIITAISLLIPSHVRISRATNIHAGSDLVWSQIDDMQRWNQWNPFFMQVPPSEIKYSDAKEGEPSSMKVGGTVIYLKEKKPDERIFVMETKGGKKVMNGFRFISNPVSNSSTLQWYIDFNLRWYPWEKFASFLFEKSYGTRIEEGLGNIKKALEENRASFY